MSELPFDIRPMREQDVAFVRQSWLRSYSRAFTTRRYPCGVSQAVFDAEHPDIVMRSILCARVDVACNPEDDDHLWGFVCYSPPKGDERALLHYVLRKPHFTGCGVGRKLVVHAFEQTGGGPMWATHWTPAKYRYGEKMTKEIQASYPAFEIDYNPYKALGHARDIHRSDKTSDLSQRAGTEEPLHHQA